MIQFGCRATVVGHTDRAVLFGASHAVPKKFFVTDGSQSTAWEQRIINADRLGTVRFIYGLTAPFLFLRGVYHEKSCNHYGKRQ